MSDSIVRDKAINFASRIVKCSNYIRFEKKNYSLADQILRSGTSIGANIFEGIYAQSDADFISKLSIALKEASETNFWILVLYNTDYIDEKMYKSLSEDVIEIIKLLTSIIKKSKEKGAIKRPINY
jgi:four helix bundle protein